MTMQNILSHENICFLGARSLRSLAQYKYIYIFCRYISGSCPPPPQYQKAGYATFGPTENVYWISNGPTGSICWISIGPT